MNRATAQVMLSGFFQMILFCFSAYASEADLYVSHLPLVQQSAEQTGLQKDAYLVLETVFLESQDQSRRKAHAATLLAFANQTDLQFDDRHFYASQAIALSQSLGMPLDTKMALLRIAGDGNFEDQQFEQAEQFYRQLSASKDLQTRMYAIYRLGWVDLNVKNRLRALNRWAKALLEEGPALQTRDPHLFHALARDFFRFWVDAVSESPKEVAGLLPILFQLKIESEEVDAIAEGVQKHLSPSRIEIVREVLMGLPFYESVRARILENGVLFSRTPCLVMHWPASLQETSDDLNRRKIQVFQQCAQELAARAMCNSPDGQKFIPLFEELKLAPDAVISRMNLSVSCKLWEKAYQDLLRLPQETATQWAPALAHDFAQQGMEHLAQQVMQRYAPVPVASSWHPVLQQLLVQKMRVKNFSEAHAFLTSFAPLALEMRPEQAAHWEYFWSHLSSEERAKNTQRSEVSLWAHSFQSKEMSVERAVEIASILVAYDCMESIWGNPKLLEALVLPNQNRSGKEIRRIFFQRSIEQLRAGQLARGLFEATSHGKILARLAALDPTLTPEEFKVLDSATGSAAISAVKEWQSLAQVRSLSVQLPVGHKGLHAPWSMTPASLKQLRMQVHRVQQQEKVLASTAWSSEVALRQARLISHQDLSILIDSLQNFDQEDPAMVSLLSSLERTLSQQRERLGMES